MNPIPLLDLSKLSTTHVLDVDPAGVIGAAENIDDHRTMDDKRELTTEPPKWEFPTEREAPLDAATTINDSGVTDFSPTAHESEQGTDDARFAACNDDDDDDERPQLEGSQDATAVAENHSSAPTTDVVEDAPVEHNATPPIPSHDAARPASWPVQYGDDGDERSQLEGNQDATAVTENHSSAPPTVEDVQEEHHAPPPKPADNPVAPPYSDPTTNQPPGAQLSRAVARISTFKRKTMWETFCIVVNEDRDPLSIIEFLDRCCDRDWPTTWVFENPHAAAFKKVMGFPECQMWFLNNHTKNTFFCRHVVKWSKSVVPLFFNAVGDAIYMYKTNPRIMYPTSSPNNQARRDDIIAAILASAKRESTTEMKNDVMDTHEHFADILSFVEDLVKSSAVARDMVGRYINDQFASGRDLPNIVSVGLVAPIVRKYYCVQPPAPLDSFVMQLLHIGTRRENMYTNAMWLHDLTQLLKHYLTVDADAVLARPDADRFLPCIWSMLAAVADAHWDHPPSWWAMRVPLNYFYPSDKAKYFPKSQADALFQSRQSIINPLSMTPSEIRLIEADIVATLASRGVVGISKANPVTLLADLEASLDALEKLFDFILRLRDALKPPAFAKSSIFTFLDEVKKPVLDNSVAIRDARIVTHHILQAMQANNERKQLLITVSERSHKEPGNFARAMATFQSASTGFWEQLSEAHDHIRKCIDAATLDELSKCTDAELCNQKLPHFRTWWNAKDRMREFFEFIGKRIDQSATFIEDELYNCLRGSTTLQTGGEYRTFHAKLQSELAASRRGQRLSAEEITGALFYNMLMFSKPAYQAARSLAERNFQSIRSKVILAGDHRTEAWGEQVNKAILHTYVVLTVVLPRRSSSRDEYNFGYLLFGMAEAQKRLGSRDFLSDMTASAVEDLTELMDSFQTNHKSAETTANEIKSFGRFECQTVKDYDGPDGISRSFWISTQSAKKSFTSQTLSADKINSMLAEWSVSKSHIRDLEQMSKTILTLRRLVEVGVNCLNSGYQEFVLYLRRNYQPLCTLLGLKSREIHGRSTGFQFEIELQRVDGAMCTQLSEAVRLVASECESFIGSIEQLSTQYPVLYCFNRQEVGFMLFSMLSGVEQSKVNLKHLIERRIGVGSAIDHAISKLNGVRSSESITRLTRLAETLSGLCEVDVTADLRPPSIWYLESPRDWPIAVANACKSGGRVTADHVCLPIGSKSDILLARENFLRRVVSGVRPADGDPIFCLVVPESESESPNTMGLLKEFCVQVRCQLYIIVHKTYAPLGRASFCNFAASRADVALTGSTTIFDSFFSPLKQQMFVVSGPSRSGKLQVCRDQALELYKQKLAPPSERFLSDSTAQHELSSLLPNPIRYPKSHSAIIEIGSGLTDHLQALIFHLIIGYWSARDGTAAHRVHPVVLKVHSDFLDDLPVLKLLYNVRTTKTRITSTLSHQFVAYARSVSQNYSEQFSSILEKVGCKLSLASTLPLTAAKWAEQQKTVYFDSSELPEYLVAFEGARPVVYCMDERVSHDVLPAEPLTHQNEPIDVRFLNGKTSEELWPMAFRVLETPAAMRVVPGIVMTPSILQCLIRLDQSVRSRQRALDRADDGITTLVGETGCGKTQMIDTYSRYRGWGKPKVIHVHSGTTEGDIVRQVSALYNEHRSAKRTMPTVIFFDEFNTSPAQDTIKRIMLDRCLLRSDGVREVLPSTFDGWIFVAACNPYAVLSEDKPAHTNHSKDAPGGRIVLKYTVQPHVAPSLVASCWRLPLATEAEEASIIRSMCTKSLIEENDAKYFERAVPFMHSFLKEHASAVPYSLRSVSRLLRLHRQLDRITCPAAFSAEGKLCKHSHEYPATPKDASGTSLPVETLSFAPLALAVNYLVSLTDKHRRQLESAKELFCDGHSLQWYLNNFGEKLKPMFNECAKKVHFALPSKILREDSVNETLAVTYLCVYTQTPLLMIGPPGSSKTLSTFMVLWGQQHKNSLHLRRLEPLYFQCSNHTTAHSLEKAIQDAKTQIADQVTFVHVLDEIGNADQAVGHPLRVLNQHLERSVFDEDGNPESIEPDALLGYQSFIGTSNYFLDRSLVGRTIVLQRDNPSLIELLQMFSNEDSIRTPDTNASIEELKAMFPSDRFPQGIDVDFLGDLKNSLVDVEQMQSRHNSLRLSSIRNSKLTMRDIFALVNVTRSEGKFDIVRAVVQTMGQRGRRILSERGRSKQDDFVRLQGDLLAERCKVMATLCGIGAKNSQLNPRDTPRQRATQQLDRNLPIQYQARRRPLMIASQNLSTIFAALDHHGLSNNLRVIYGKHLVADDQMIASTMLQLRSAMMTDDQVCLLVDCEQLIDSMYDVFNGFYQRDDEVADYTVRVVLDGRSDDWPIKPLFNLRCILAVLDDTIDTAIDAIPKGFTPALESRFEQVVITPQMFQQSEKSKQVVAARTAFQMKYFGQTLRKVLDSPIATEIIGWHPLMLSCCDGLDLSMDLLGRSDIVVANTTLSNSKVLQVVADLTTLQSTSQIIFRHTNASKEGSRSHSLVLCPVDKICGGGDLNSLSQAASLLKYMQKEFFTCTGQSLHTLPLRSGTLDMLFEIAVRNILGTASFVAIAISHSPSSPINETQLLAVCHFIASVAEGRTQVILFAPICDSNTIVTIPSKWRTSYCNAVAPVRVDQSATEKWCSSPQCRLHSLDLVRPVRYKVFSADFLHRFENAVKESLAERSLTHLRDRVADSYSVAQGLAEVEEYVKFICSLRWWLSLHWSNHMYFCEQNINLHTAWKSFSATIASKEYTLADPGSFNFLLSPAREAGLPLAPCVPLHEDNTCDLLRARCDAVRRHLSDDDILQMPRQEVLDFHHLITLARLSGAQSNAEILALLELHSTCLTEESPDTFPWPLNLRQLSSLRVFAAISPRTSEARTPSHVETGNPCGIIALLRATSPKERAVALAGLCVNASHSLSLQRVHLGDLPRQRNARFSLVDDIFVRITLLHGSKIASKLFSDMSNLENEATIKFSLKGCREKVISSVLTNLGLAQVMCDSDDTDDARDKRQSRVQNLRRQLKDLESAGLEYIGHYVYLLRVLKEHLFAIEVEDAGTPLEKQIGTVTLEMVESLTLSGLPDPLRHYVLKLFGVVGHHLDSENVLEVFEVIRLKVLQLSEGNNRILTQCHELLNDEIGEYQKDVPVVEWPFLTIHHRVISTELFDEVWESAAGIVSAAQLAHFSEVAIGLPHVCLDNFPSPIAKVVFQSEPIPQDFFC